MTLKTSTEPYDTFKVPKIGDYSICRGIGSRAYGVGDMKRPAHVLQLDLDDIGAHPFESDLTSDLPRGIYLATRTGPESYNVTSLNLFTRYNVIDAKAAIQQDDADHLKIGIKRGYWILRLSGKNTRARPEFAGLYSNLDRYGTITMSKPHTELYDKLYPSKDLRSCYPAARYEGKSLDRETYPTRVE